MSTPSDTRTAYLYARILLGVSVFLSLACNAAHAYLNTGTAPLWLTLGVGAIPPLILALSVEATVFCSRHARWAWGWTAVTAAAGAGLVTGFSMSFAAISDLGRMAGMTWWTAPMLPVGIDALVITGLGMVALFRPRHVAVQPIPAPEPQPTRVTEQRRDSHELPAMPPEQLAAMHRETQSFQIAPTAPLRNLTTDAVPAANREPQPASPAMQTPTNREADTDEFALTGGDSRESLPARREAPAPIRRLAAVPAPRFAAESPEEQVTIHTPAHREVEAEQVTAHTLAHRDSQAAQVTEQVTAQKTAVREAADDANSGADAGSEAAVRGPEPTPEQIELAQAVIDRGKTKASLEVVSAIIAAKSAGMTNKEAAAAVAGADASLVQRVWAAAKNITETASA
ncbi:hypothetical protein [Mycolicibacterium llatzerense]|uniref:hypothetical protein n=1 Tax=Mycolicibacterium llatzerense TaxID=280871 RepID=UPI0008DE4B6F|nr:hypothetical protein [Mycolicibacterium llatzerense]